MRSLKLLRDQGYLAAVTEHWNQFARRRLDLFGFIDLVAIKGDETLAVQTTTAANISARIAKIKQTPAAELWLESPNRKLQVHGWVKRGPRAKRKTWQCRIIHCTKASPIVAPTPATP